MDCLFSSYNHKFDDTGLEWSFDLDVRIKSITEVFLVIYIFFSVSKSSLNGTSLPEVVCITCSQLFIRHLICANWLYVILISYRYSLHV